jgi:hypothetical protein
VTRTNLLRVLNFVDTNDLEATQALEAGKAEAPRQRACWLRKNEEATTVDWALLALGCLSLGAAGAMAGCTANGATTCDPLADAAVIRCPGLYTLSVVPDQAALGGAVTLTATVTSDVDAGTPMFLWSAPSGTFADPAASSTSFTCTAPGNVPVAFVVKREGCREMLSASVNCVAAADGGNADGAGDGPAANVRDGGGD